MDDSLKAWLPWIGGAAVLLIILAAFFLTRDSGDEVAAPATTIPPTTTVPETTTTTVAPTTTVPETTTTTVAPTTTVPETTTTTVAPTTTVPEPTTVPPAPATVEFTNQGIYAGETWIYFGFDDEATISAVTAVLGTPTFDSGWEEAFLCPPPERRTVRWDDLWLLFTTADTDFWIGGIPHFFTYQYSGSAPELFTTEGIGLGSTLNDLDDAYGGPDLIIEDSDLVVGAGSWTYKDAPWTGMWGLATGTAPSDTITSINGGAGCGE
jgi:hypothetical protein